ncbi:MAG: S-layer homology domain-containing protein [Clostridia bacterium]|nr:S-layer homology domain-containing protein [Clostridia bacterium]
MKKTAILLACIMLIGVLPLFSSAGGTYIVENDPVMTPFASPEIDGEIGQYEGWSSPALFNADTAAPFWRFMAQTTDAKLYFAYSREGLYFAAKIVEHELVAAKDQNGVMRDYEGNGFVYSDGFDTDGDETRVTSYGWNGDVMTLMVDPGRLVFLNSRSPSRANTVWYNIGLFHGEDGDYPRVYRSQVNYGEITGEVGCAGHKVGNGWTVEVMIPWEIIAEDINILAPRLERDITAEELWSGAYLIKAAAMYMDRFYDEEQRAVETWGRYVTVCEKCTDGTPGWATSGPVAKSLGLTLVLGDKPVFSDIPSESWYSVPVYICHYNGIVSGMGDGVFAPKRMLRRSEFVTMLAAFAKADTYAYGDPHFEDVPAGKWYAKPVMWAYSKGYAAGVSESLFAPNRYVSREMLVQMLYSYARKNGKDVSGRADLSGYSDLGSVSGWARNAVSWAVDAGMIAGTSKDTLSPQKPATRAEASVILVKFARFCGEKLITPYDLYVN